jgi:hypothetical protein
VLPQTSAAACVARRVPEEAQMSEWFALRPLVGTEAPAPKRAAERRPPADPDGESSPTEEATTDE